MAVFGRGDVFDSPKQIDSNARWSYTVWTRMLCEAVGGRRCLQLAVGHDSCMIQHLHGSSCAFIGPCPLVPIPNSTFRGDHVYRIEDGDYSRLAKTHAIARKLRARRWPPMAPSAKRHRNTT
jgi:hypothetical protein